MDSIFFIALVGYIVFILILSLIFFRKAKSLEDFFLASRNLPASLVFLSVTASWIGATSTLVSVDDAFARGISSVWVMALPTVVTVLVFAVFLVRPIRRLPIVSLPDLVEMRYGPLVRHISAGVIVWYMVLLSASQMVALGRLLSVFVKTSYFNALVLGTVVVLIYSILGGYFSVVITDGFQFFLLATGLILLFVWLVSEGNLLSLGVTAVDQGKSHFFSFFFDIKRNFLIFLSFTMSWLISPITWQRIQSAKDENSARTGLQMAALILIVLFAVLTLIGMMSLSQLSGQNAGESVLSRLIISDTGPILAVLLFVAIVAAVMSTLDTAVNTGSLSLTRDVFQKIWKPAEGRRSVTVSRISTLMVGIMAFLVASRFQDILKTLGLASEVMAEGLFVPGMAMLFLKRRYPKAGLFSLVLGSLFAVLGFLTQVDAISWNWPVWPASVPVGVGVSGIGFFLGAVLDRKNQVS